MMSLDDQFGDKILKKYAAVLANSIVKMKLLLEIMLIVLLYCVIMRVKKC